MSTSPPAWHPDPSDPNALRWWDGTRWTGHTQPVPPAADREATPVTGPQIPAVYSGQSGSGAPAGQPGGYSQPYPVRSQPFPGGGTPWYTGGGSTRSISSRWAALRYNNRFSFTAVVTAAIYLAIAVTIHFVLIGILPVMSAVRAYQRREKLAPLAAVAAALAVASFVLFLHGR